MPRVKRGVTAKARHKKILKKAKGYYGARSRVFRVAKQAVIKAAQYSYRDRRNKKRDIRSLWIVKINAACRNLGITYSRFIEGIHASDLDINRKMLASIAVNDPSSFEAIADTAKKALEQKQAA